MTPPLVFQDVDPNTRIDLLPALFGSGSYIMLNEQIASTSGPAPGQLSGGTYAADLEVNMIRVHISATSILREKIDITVAHAKAHSDFPQTTLCAGRNAQAVSGHAFLVSERTSPSLLPVTVGLVEIPASGGFATKDVTAEEVDLLELVSNATGTTATFGSLSPFPHASSFAEVEDLCVLNPVGLGCLLGATLLRTEANSAGTGGSAGSNTGDNDGDGDTRFIGLEILGNEVILDPMLPDTITIPGLGFLTINEAFCGAGSMPTCGSGGDTAVTVRSLHLVLTVPGLIGVEVIVSESHSDAHTGAAA